MHCMSWINGALVPCEWSARGCRSLVRLSLSVLAERYPDWDLATPDEALDRLTSEDEDTVFVFVDDKVLCLSVSMPWFSWDNVLSEVFVDEGISLEEIVTIMECVAKTTGLSRIAVGTRAVPGGRHAGLAKLYSRVGMTVSTIELMRVIP